jgi:glycosyltransferase involved in cell wall biosynthesis
VNATKVSVVIPVHNGERFLAQSIDGVLRQDHPSIELIVVDDGSTDSTAKLVSGYEKVRYVFQENAGASAARNAGIAASTGDLITFCDYDDVYRESKVSAQVEHLLSHLDTACVLVHHRTFVEAGTQPPPWMEKDDRGVQSPMIRRVVLEQVGGYDARYRMSETVEWLTRMKAAGLAVDVLEQVLVDRRLHGSNLSYQRADLQQSLLRSLRERVGEKRAPGGGR